MQGVFEVSAFIIRSYSTLYFAYYVYKNICFYDAGNPLMLMMMIDF